MSKNSAASEMAKKRWEGVSKEERSEIAKRLNEARWKKEGNKKGKRKRAA